MSAPTGHCGSAREWASRELDGELSSFERLLLDAHVRACPSCAEFRDGIAVTTAALRSEPLLVPERRVVAQRQRRRPQRVRFTAAAAAAAVALVALGLASSISNSPGSQDPFRGRIAPSVPRGPEFPQGGQLELIQARDDARAPGIGGRMRLLREGS